MSNPRTTPAANGTPVRPPRARKAVADKPAGIAMNLDTLTREGDRPAEFAFVAGGRRFVIPDPLGMSMPDLDAIEAAVAAQDVRAQFRAVMSEDDANAFLAMPIPLWKVLSLIERYFGHYNYDVAALLGNTGASPTS